MPKVSKTTATDRGSIPGLFDYAMAEVDGYSIVMERYDVDFDAAFVYRGLPNDQCQASHVGYILTGKFTVQMADGSEEVLEGGDAAVIPPGHTWSATAGTEFVIFTPAEEYQAQVEVMQANMMKYAAEQGIEVPG
jgi:glyoxylate utilization-related uncharacterized protein